MPRYEDRYNGTRLYVGHLSSRTRSRDLEDLFSRYGRLSVVGGGIGEFGDSFYNLMRVLIELATLKLVFCSSEGRGINPLVVCDDGLTVSGNHLRRVRDVDMKRDYAFVDFSDPRDADDARYALSGRDVDGSRITVEFSRGVPRGPGGSRGDHGGGDRGDRGGGGSRPVPGSGRCFNCGVDGHWARDCKSGDWKNKCYRCGERGHVERNCQNSPKKLRRGRSYSRSPSPRRGRSPSRSRSYSRSRSPPKRERAVENVDRSRSPRHSRSPKRQKASPPVSRGRKHSLTPEDRSPRGRVSLSPRDDDDRRGANGSDYGGSPRPKSISPVADKADRGRDDLSPMEANGGEERSPSPAPRSKRSAREDGEDDYRASPRVSE